MPKGIKGFQKGVPSWVKGKKLSDEHKRKIGLSKIGKKRIITEEWRKNMGKSRKGKIFSISHRRNISLSLRGEKSSFWKGGLTEKNKLLRSSIEYKIWRKAVFERDNYTCVWCMAHGVELQADHIKPFALFPELRFAIDNGRTLCVECHKTTDTYLNGTRWKRE